MFSYVVYIKDQWDLDPSVCDLKELRSCALIKTSKGFVNPSLEPVHFTVAYGNKLNLQKEFPSKSMYCNCIIELSVNQTQVFGKSNTYLISLKFNNYLLIR